MKSSPATTLTSPRTRALARSVDLLHSWEPHVRASMAFGRSEMSDKAACRQWQLQREKGATRGLLFRDCGPRVPDCLFPIMWERLKIAMGAKPPSRGVTVFLLLFFFFRLHAHQHPGETGLGMFQHSFAAEFNRGVCFAIVLT